MKTSPQRQGRNQLRIIGGKWRGRKLDFPSVAGLRPTGDRIRETLFNWLAPVIEGAHCLDLCAGSGALGLEAVSRGAARAVLVDNDPQVVRQLQVHRERLVAEQLELVQANALQWLAANPGQRFDLVFLDPPFQSGLLQPLADALMTGEHLRDDALIYVETARDQSFLAPACWHQHRQKFAGQVSFALYRFESGTADANDESGGQQ